MLAAAIDIRRWLEEDRQTPFSERLARDRAIGRTIGATDDFARVLAWWRSLDDQVATDGSGRGSAGATGKEIPPWATGIGVRVARYRRIAVAVLLLLGMLLGTATAAVAFAYDGRHPVNLFLLLGLLVVLPGMLLLVTLLLLLRSGGTGSGRAAGGILAALNAGRWAGAVLDRVARIELFAPAVGAPLGLAAFARWQILAFSQWTAVGFFVGAMGHALLLVAFTDLAFGWSTTLEVAVADAHRVFATLAAPWAGWFPAAAPDLALTEASRYFRGEAPALAADRAARLGAWWPFVFIAVLVYGLLPRLLLLGWVGWRLRAATRALLCRDPEVTALLDRLAAPVVAPGGGAEGAQPLTPQRELPAPAPTAAAPEALLVIWNRALPVPAAEAWLAGRLALRASAVLEAGVLESEAAQRAAVAGLVSAARGTAAARRLIVLTRGWEPPLLEFADFLGLVRELAGTDPSITVVPVDVTGTRVEAADRAVWAKTLGRLRDPRLYVQEALP